MIRWLIRATALALCALVLVAAWRIVTLPEPDRVLPPLAGKIDLIEIAKSDRRMTGYRDGVALRSYDIALGFSPVGDKTRLGDGRTPEGRFRIDRRNPNSKFHLSLGLDYPHPEDIEHAASYGFSPGGDIFIHGQPTWFPGTLMRGDWTEGCIAVTDADMREIWRVTDLGTEVVIRP